MDCPAVLVSTPSKCLHFMENGALKGPLTRPKVVVLDEADLLLSFGYREDVGRIATALGATAPQMLLLSATLEDELQACARTWLRDPVCIALSRAQEGAAEQAQLAQYVLPVPTAGATGPGTATGAAIEESKYLVLYVLLKLKILQGRMLLFVSGLEGAYRLKLFLESFWLRGIVLNGALPLASRQAILEEANQGKYDVIIATGPSDAAPSAAAKHKDAGAEDAEFGVHRGIDIQGLSCVINVDVPASVAAYRHRVGRVGRGREAGLALTLVAYPSGLALPGTQTEEQRRMAAIRTAQETRGITLQDFAFDVAQVEGFRYRVLDVYRRLTPALLREARLKDLSSELLAREHLKAKLAASPALQQTLQAARASKLLQKERQPHLKHVPEYLMLAATKPETGGSAEDIHKISLHKLALPQATGVTPAGMTPALSQPSQKKRKHGAGPHHAPSAPGAGNKKKRANQDPLKRFKKKN